MTRNASSPGTAISASSAASTAGRPGCSLSNRGSPWSNSWYSIAFDPFVKGRVYAAVSNTHDIPDWRLIDDLPHQTGGVCVSENGGDTWKRLWA